MLLVRGARCEHSEIVNQAHIIRRIVDMAETGDSPSPDAALASLAAVIDRLDMSSDTYEVDVVALMGAGAALWRLGGPKAEQGGDDPH